ncbi:MAG: hypothetical protein M3P33_01685 [bacterium]|nr:hypothetical protein [bacterium]
MGKENRDTIIPKRKPRFDDDPSKPEETSKDHTHPVHAEEARHTRATKRKVPPNRRKIGK